MKTLPLALVAALAALLAGPRAEAATLDVVRGRGQLVCGVNTGLAGFSLADSQGMWRGLDVDYCRAIAAAVLGDGTKVRFVPLTAATRFTALQSGEIDVLLRNSTETYLRDVSLGLTALPVNFFDGQGFAVRASSGVKSATELNGATVCMAQGTTHEANALGKPLGLDARWPLAVLRTVGTYGESFERNVGQGSQLKLARGQNALWTQGGLMYAVPFR